MYQIYPNAKIHIFFNLESPKKIAQNFFLTHLSASERSRGVSNTRDQRLLVCIPATTDERFMLN